MTLPMRHVGQPGLPTVRLARGHTFQGVLAKTAGAVRVTVEQDADAVQAQAARTTPDGATLLPYQAVDRGNVTIVATSTADEAVKYAVAVSIDC